MKSTFRCLVVLGLAALATCYPSPDGKNYEEGDKFEGDILLTLDQQRNGLVNEFYRWPGGKVYYKFYSNHHDAAERSVILTAMEQIQKASCITFHPAVSSTSVYINITGMDEGCYASVGYYPIVRNFNLQKRGCVYVATAIHELLHTLGFYHQQSATDRDKYVRIQLQNVEPGKEHNFNVYSSSVVGDFGISYDYGSIMHYGPTAFSKNGAATIVPLDPTAVIGQRNGLSQKDITKLNRMYKCP